MAEENTQSEDVELIASEEDAVEVSPAEAKAKAAVEAFVSSYLRNSSFSQDTPAWNHFQAGIPVLIGCIVKEMEG